VKAENIVDEIKARSTLVALVQPTAWVSQLASHPAKTSQILAGIGGSVVHGNFGEAGKQLGGMLDDAMHPTGVPGFIYKSGLYMQAGVDTLVGGVEVYAGVRDKDKFLLMMGGADLVGAGSSYAFALGGTGVALGLNIASNVSRAALVLINPDKFSRIQKAKTFFDGMASVSAGLMKAGVASVPALAGYVGFGVTQILYMNNAGFRGKVDAAVDWVMDKLK